MTALRVGIVGSEGAKFTPYTRILAKVLIRRLLKNATTVVSGACHLGGIDLWAEEIARSMGVNQLIFPPKEHSWEAGYKLRNIEIAKAADEVHCITVKELPPGFKGMRFASCYHCGTSAHVKSGGCWTVKYAKRLHKPAFVHVIEAEG